MTIPDVSFYVLILSLMGVAVCIIVTLLSIRAMHENAPLLKWWTAALLCVLLIHYNRLLSYPKQYPGDMPLMIEGLLSNLSNLALLAMVGSIGVRRLPWHAIRKNNRAWLVLVSTAPVWLLLVTWAMLGYSPEGHIPGAYALLVRVQDAIFSAFALSYAGKLLGANVVSLAKAIGWWFSCYACYQLLYIPFAFDFRVGVLGSRDLEALYLGVAFFFKIAATFLLVSVASEVSKVRQLMAMTSSTFGSGLDRGLRRASGGRIFVLAICVGHGRATVDAVKQQFARRDVTLLVLPQERLEKVSVQHLFALTVRCKFCLGLFGQQPSARAMMILEAILSQRKGCLVLARRNVAWKMDSSLAPSYFAQYEDGDEAAGIISQWLDEHVRPRVMRALERVPEILQTSEKESVLSIAR